MWLGGIWVPVTKEIVYGIGVLLLLILIVGIVVAIKRKKDNQGFSSSRLFRGKNLERASKSFLKTKNDVNYDDMPIVGLNWSKDGDQKKSPNFDEGMNDDDDDEDQVDDGYTVVEKTIQEKAKQLPFVPPQKQSAKSSPSPSSSPKKEAKSAVKKDATGDKMDFFTTGKSAL
jgi:hypothetical protein